LPESRSIKVRTKENNMDVEVIYRQPDGTETDLGLRRLAHMPPVDEPFELDHHQFVSKGYQGPDDDGRYRLFVEDDPDATRH
jgi:hypothetical protein